MTVIFFDPRQNVKGLDSFSPSAAKPARFTELAGIYDPIRFGKKALGEVVPVTKEDLLRVHSKSYVEGVFDGVVLNGFENNDKRVPQASLWNIGSLYAAAKHAIENPAHPQCSPSSGFHHAYHSYGGGFCTFNGLAVVAAKILDENPNSKVGILDCDMHYGDGTADILKRFPDLGKRVIHVTQGNIFYGEDKKGEAQQFFPWLTRAIEKINRFGCTVVLYQAGADPHIKDPLGGFLNDEQLRRRDEQVFRSVSAPIAWCLAGGYQRTSSNEVQIDPVLRIHVATLEASCDAHRYRGAIQEPDVVREHFHKYLIEHEGFDASRLQAPAPGRSYSGSHAQRLWECFEHAFKLGRKSS